MDSKAVSPLIGFILLMAILMGLIGILQSTAVPQWNREVEAKHFSSIKYEFADLSEAISISAISGNPVKVVMKAGVDYPNYYILFSPTKTATTVSAKNLSVLISGHEPFKTSAIILEPNYLYSQRSKLIYEHSAVLKFENNVVLEESAQNAFAGDSISLALIEPKFSTFATTETATLILVPVSVGGRNLFSGNITFESYDEKTAEWWNETLSKVFEGSGVIVGINETDAKKVDVKNLKNVTLSISVFEAYIMSSGEVSQKQTPHRFIVLTGTDFEVYQYSTVMLGAKLIDIFGNPIKNWPVVVSSDNGECNVNSQTLLTNERGEVWYYFNANVNPEDNNTIVTCTITFRAENVENVEQQFTVRVNTSTPFCEECPSDGGYPSCPPSGGLSSVRSATLQDCSFAYYHNNNLITVSGICAKNLTAWVDNNLLWFNNSTGCAVHIFNFTLSYSLNSSIQPVLVWNGTCEDKAGQQSALIFINSISIDSPRNGGNNEVEVTLNSNDFSGQKLTVYVVCSSKKDKDKEDKIIHCPSGQAPWNLSTNYIEIFFVKR